VTLLDAVKLAYRKHHLNDDSIGWDELSEMLGRIKEYGHLRVVCLLRM
jgi:hypothetical protein